MAFRIPASHGLGVVLAFFVSLASAWAQPSCSLSLSGRITDHESREALVGATVVLLESQWATQADAQGNFHFHVCAGTYHVQVSFIGYDTETIELRVERAIIRDFKLHPDAIVLKGAIVHGERVATPTATPSTTLQGRELLQTRGQTLGEALTRITGVTALQTGPGVFKPMIHGLHSNRVTILNNGVRQEGQQWGQEHGPEIDPFIASRLTVVKGAASVRYGSDAIGGVILVDPKPLRDSAGTGAELNLVGMSNNAMGAASGMLEGNLRQVPALSWRAQGSVRRAGNMRAPGYYLTNSGFSEHSFSGAVGWHQETYGIDLFASQFNTRIGIIPAASQANTTDFALAVARDRPLETAGFSYDITRGYQQVRHDLYKVSGFVKTGTTSRLTANVSLQYDYRDEYDRFRPRNQNATTGELPELSYINRTSIAELLWEHKLTSEFTGSVGLTGTYQFNNYPSGSRQFIPFYNNYVGGAFWIEQWHHNKWQVEGGLRLDRRDLQVRRGAREVQDSLSVFVIQRYRHQYTTPAASLGTIFEPTPHLTLSLNGTLTRRAPTANERYSQGVHNAQYELGYDLSYGYADGRPTGAPGLDPETSLQTTLTATWHHNPRLNGELTVYQNQISGYIYQTPILPVVLDIRGALISWLFTQTDARFRGLDALATYQLAPRWLLGSKVAIVRARDTQQDEWLIYTPADRGELSLRYALSDPTGQTRLTQRFVQVNGTGVARQTRVPANYEARDYRTPPAGYALLGLEAGATVRWGRLPLDVSLTGGNLLNQRYRDYLNRYRYFTDEMGRNVTLRVRVPLELTKSTHKG